MVGLSLLHPTRLKRQATLLSESLENGPQRVLFVLTTIIAICNFAFFILGTFIAARIDYGWYGEPGGPPEPLHKEGTIVVDRAGLVFFYCTIPLVLLAVSVFEILQHRTSQPFRPVLSLVCGGLGLLAWLIQFSLQGTCILPTSRFNTTSAEAGWCAFELRQWDPRSYWSSGLAVAWYVTWCVLVMVVLYLTQLIVTLSFFLRQRKAAGKQSIMPQAYQYHSPLEEREMHTNRDIPDRSATNTPLPSGHTRTPSHPPRYGDGGIFHEELDQEEKSERDMV
ncbi:hypothetical protein LTR86_010771 [Recurvomyces mirabilis]|nr:hypothetical protein LTR86_010771 [Recurvomyces mirabilis]